MQHGEKLSSPCCASMKRAQFWDHPLLKRRPESRPDPEIASPEAMGKWYESKVGAVEHPDAIPKFSVFSRLG